MSLSYLNPTNCVITGLRDNNKLCTVNSLCT